MEIIVVVLELKEYGFGVTNIRGRTALRCTAKSRHEGVVKMQLYGTIWAPHRGYGTRYGGTALMWAIVDGVREL